MKHLYRKPLLPVLLMVMLLFGTCFMTLFQKGMAEDKQRIEDIYNYTHIYIEAFPKVDTEEQLRMVVYRGNAAAELPEIADSMVVQQCYYKLSEAFGTEGASAIYGTNHPDEFAKYRDIRISWGDGWDRETFLDIKERPGCLMEEDLAKKLGVSVGDEFAIIPLARLEQEVEEAPEVIFTVAGVFDRRQSGLEQGALIVPNTIFKGDGGLLYNSVMVNNCFYQVYRLELDTAYNREIDVVLEKIEKKLIDKYNLVTNARTMKQAIRPIEQKIMLQEMLEIPLMVVFMIATMVIGLLLALSLKTEMFLRFLVGEKRLGVFLKMLGSLLISLTLFGAIALLGVGCTAGVIWVAKAMDYLLTTVLLTGVVMAVPLIIISSKNLVKLYQQREG